MNSAELSRVLYTHFISLHPIVITYYTHYSLNYMNPHEIAK